MKNKKYFVENRKLKFSRKLFSRDIHRFFFGSFWFGRPKKREAQQKKNFEVKDDVVF